MVSFIYAREQEENFLVSIFMILPVLVFIGITTYFIFSDYDEFPVQGDSSLARVTPQGLVQGGISDLRDLAQLGVNKLFGYEE